MSQRSGRTIAVVAAGLGLALGVTACSGAGAGGGGGGDDAESIDVLMVNNPQMEDLQSLTEEHFTAETGITVNYTVLPENDVRDRIAQEFAAQSGIYDVASVSNYEVPIFAANGWLAPLTQVSEDAEFAQDDVFPALTEAMKGPDGEIYGEPFYGESSFLMYRTDVFEQAGLTMPPNPTWTEVAQLAAQVDGVVPGMKGICLRGQPGWGQVFAPLNTVINTFGGAWYDMDWNAQMTTPEMTQAVQFYVDLLQQHGEAGAAQAGFLECLTAFQQGQTAMWYDATANAPLVEGADSPIAGNIGYVAAPVEQTESSGWLYSWAWGVQAASEKQDAASEFIAWASGSEYEQLAGTELGWTHVPAGKRQSTYEIPEYQEVAAAWYQQELDALNSVDPSNPGVAPRPYTGVQFIAIPEFPDMGTQVSQQISAAIAGQVTVEEALATSQSIVQRVGDDYKDG